jgi:hypothetical protein
MFTLQIIRIYDMYIYIIIIYKYIIIYILYIVYIYIHSFFGSKLIHIWGFDSAGREYQRVRNSHDVRPGEGKSKSKAGRNRRKGQDSGAWPWCHGMGNLEGWCSPTLKSPTYWTDERKEHEPRCVWVEIVGKHTLFDLAWMGFCRNITGFEND